MDPKQRKRRPADTDREKKRRKRTVEPKPAKERTKERRSDREVVYTPATQFSRNRFLLRLATVIAVVLALIFGVSIFFKVEKIEVSGMEKYSAYDIQQASGIEYGDNLLTFGKAEAYGNIITKLPYVKSVRIRIKLPDTVNIVVEEQDVLYAVKDSEDGWWLITAEGKVVDKGDTAVAGECTQILGVTLQTPVAGQQAVAYETPIDPTQEETQPVTVRGSDKLGTALSILQYLEDCGIIGKAASVDVSDLGDLELWYGTQYEVKLGDTSQLKYKIQCMNEAINGESGLKEYDSGVLDISFTIKKDQIVYDPRDGE